MPVGQQPQGGAADGPREVPKILDTISRHASERDGLVPVPRRRFVSVGVDKLPLEDTEEGGTGEVVVATPPVPGGFYMLVERIVVLSDSTSDSEVTVYSGEVSDANEADFTGAGNHDVADETRPIVVLPESALRVRWTGLSAGARCVATVQFQLAQLIEEG